MSRRNLPRFAGLRNGDLVRYAQRPLLPRHLIVAAAAMIALISLFSGCR
jgi:hypothetical protein